MRISFLPALLISVLSVLRADPLPVGSPAPDITAPDQNGKPVHFARVYARGVTLVYFYPKAGTPGCTDEACSLRDAYSDLRGHGLHIIGVSRDTAASQNNFQQKNHLPFTLIADPEGKVAAAFGVPELMKGLLPLDSRESFLVKSGKIAWNSPHAQTKGSADEVKKALASLK